MINLDYINKQIELIESRRVSRQTILNCKWRIASHADLFKNLNPDGTLTPDQLEAIDEWIHGFKAAQDWNKHHA